MAPSSMVRTAAAAIILNEDRDKVLLMQRNRDPFFGAWMMPGGNQMAGETLEECACRETFEEIGMHVKVKRLFDNLSEPGVRDDYHVTVAFYVAIPLTKELKLDPGVMDARWFGFHEIPDNMAFRHKEILERFIEEQSSNAFTDFVSTYPFASDYSKPGRVLNHTKIGDVHMYRLLIEPGVVTGNYYHKETFIMFSVESGEIDATFVQVKTGERTDITIQAQKQAVHVPPFNALAVANVSDQPAVLYIFSNKRLRGNDDLAYPIKHISEDDPTKTQYH